LRKIFIGLWWVILCLIPLFLLGVLSGLEHDIGCPQIGDCYLPGYLSIGIIKAIALFMITAVASWRPAYWKSEDYGGVPCRSALRTNRAVLIS
jgi:hypothetical protein